MPRYRELSRYILSRWLILCVMLLAGTALCLLRARAGFGMAALRLYEFAGTLQFAALVAFGCATFGSLLMEDMLRYYGE